MVGQQFIVDGGAAGHHPADGADVVLAVVEAGNHGRAHPDGQIGKILADPAEIFQDQGVVHAGLRLVLARVQAFDVEDQPVQMRAGVAQALVGVAAAGLDGGVDAAAAGFAQQGDGKFMLHEGFAAGKGHAAAKAVVEDAVLFHFIQRLTHAHAFAVDALRARGAGPHAGETFLALVAVMADQAVRRQTERARGAGREAAAADPGREAARGIEGVFGLEALGFGIAAPAAAQGTALEKDQGRHAR